MSRALARLRSRLSTLSDFAGLSDYNALSAVISIPASAPNRTESGWVFGSPSSPQVSLMTKDQYGKQVWSSVSVSGSISGSQSANTIWTDGSRLYATLRAGFGSATQTVGVMNQVIGPIAAPAPATQPAPAPAPAPATTTAPAPAPTQSTDLTALQNQLALLQGQCTSGGGVWDAVSQSCKVGGQATTEQPVVAPASTPTAAMSAPATYAQGADVSTPPPAYSGSSPIVEGYGEPIYDEVLTSAGGGGPVDAVEIGVAAPELPIDDTAGSSLAYDDETSPQRAMDEATFESPLDFDQADETPNLVSVQAGPAQQSFLSKHWLKILGAGVALWLARKNRWI